MFTYQKTIKSMCAHLRLANSVFIIFILLWLKGWFQGRWRHSLTWHCICVIWYVLHVYIFDSYNIHVIVILYVTGCFRWRREWPGHSDMMTLICIILPSASCICVPTTKINPHKTIIHGIIAESAGEVKNQSSQPQKTY